MIEKYFKQGVRLQWNKPANVDGTRDGAMVDGIRPTAQMRYIGLGAVVEPVLMGSHVSTFGLQMNMPIQHKWLDYTPGRTARVPIGPYDVLTGFMSGCIIARWSERGVDYVGHVGTVESDPAVNRLVKRTFGFAMPRGTTGFNPALAWDYTSLRAIMTSVGTSNLPQVMALVTTQGAFYSLAVIGESPNKWYCCGIKRCPTIDHDTLKMRMMRVD